MSLQILEWDNLLSRIHNKALPSAMTIGFFDGVHQGHTELIKHVVRYGENPTVVTFKENPKKFFEREKYPGDIFSLKQKLSALKILGIQQVILIDFSEKFSRMRGEDFINLLIDRGNLCYMAVGNGFRCGHRMDTNADFIKKMNEAKGIPTEIIPSLSYGNGFISSSRIRSAIIQGELDLAAALLGRNLELELESAELDEGRLIFDVRDRLIPPQGYYKVLMYKEISPKGLMEKVWEGDIEIGKGKIIIPYSEYSGCIKINFLIEFL